MADVHPLPQTTPQEEPPPLDAAEATVTHIDVRCALCGKKLSGRALRHQLVPPQSSRKTITVCHTCSRAALGEGYRLVQ